MANAWKLIILITDASVQIETGVNFVKNLPIRVCRIRARPVLNALVILTPSYASVRQAEVDHVARLVSAPLIVPLN